MTASLGLVVRLRRRELRMSQEELAWRAGLNRTYITDVERGVRNLSLATIDRLAKALQTPLPDLLGAADKGRGGEPAVTVIDAEAGVIEILLVEDNPRDSELTLRALRRHGLSNGLKAVSDGEEALEYLRCEGRYSNRQAENRHLLVLLDLKMPKLDGLEVLRRIKADSRTKSVPVVVLTVSEDNADITEAHRLGAEASMLKPVSFARLCKITPGLTLSWSLTRSIAPVPA